VRLGALASALRRHFPFPGGRLGLLISLGVSNFFDFLIFGVRGFRDGDWIGHPIYIIQGADKIGIESDALKNAYNRYHSLHIIAFSIVTLL
jgi:hypothetical protein